MESVNKIKINLYNQILNKIEKKYGKTFDKNIDFQIKIKKKILKCYNAIHNITNVEIKNIIENDDDYYVCVNCGEKRIGDICYECGGEEYILYSSRKHLKKLKSEQNVESINKSTEERINKAYAQGYDPKQMDMRKKQKSIGYKLDTILQSLGVDYNQGELLNYTGNMKAAKEYVLRKYMNIFLLFPVKKDIIIEELKIDERLFNTILKQMIREEGNQEIIEILSELKLKNILDNFKEKETLIGKYYDRILEILNKKYLNDLELALFEWIIRKNLTKETGQIRDRVCSENKCSSKDLNEIKKKWIDLGIINNNMAFVI